jgi:hypothetical protein
MARYILIDNNSGYIFGDSADLDGKVFSGSAVEFAAALDASIGAHNRTYEEYYRNPRTTESGYDVYRADIDGSEAVAVVHNGQDQETIEAVRRDCEYSGYIAIRDLVEA